jgi:hypothetical protein
VTKEIALNFQFTPSPFFKSENKIFDDSLLIEIGHQKQLNWEEIKIEYRYWEDSVKTYIYSEPFTISKSSIIETRQVSTIGAKDINSMPGNSTYYSPWVKASFIKRDKAVHLDLKTEYANQYAASGPNTLIDGIQGTKEFRTGDWQGFFAKDLVTEVKFDTPRSLKEVGISCLQDMKSWIFYPSSIEIEISFDGVTFEKLAPINTLNTSSSKVNSPETIPNFTDYVGPTIDEFYTQTNTLQPVSAIRIVAKNYGKCPSWHLGVGNDTWLFSDELIFR